MLNRPIAFVLTVLALVVPALSLSAGQAAGPLPSWSDGASRKAIIDFVSKVTKEGSPDFVKPAERIAVFDNDGTLWAEQPAYFQLVFMIDRAKAMAADHPEWKTTEPFKSAIAGDMKALMATGKEGLAKIGAATHTNMTAEEFAGSVRDWLKTAKHPKTGMPYNKMVYQPMLELLEYLRASGFKTFIVSGGGIDFMRVFAEETYGIPPEQVVGSSVAAKFEMRDGVPTIIKQPQDMFVDDKEGKPVGIYQHIGRRPIFAAGNSDGDLQMLQYTTTARDSGDNTPRFGLIVHHTDADREWAYDRESHIGKLDKALDEAASRGWTVVSMKDDWKTIFPAQASSKRTGESRSETGTITGTVAYRQRIALPPDAVVHVRLEDVSKADAPSTLVSDARVPTEGRQVPIPFRLAYDASKIDASHTYHLRASILSGGSVLFTTTQAYPVLTQGAGREAQIILQQASGGAQPSVGANPPSAGSVALEGPRWRLVELGSASAIDSEVGPGAGIMFVGKDHSIAANTGVNGLGGTYSLTGDRLAITTGVMTMMAGPEPLMKQEQAFLAALKRVTSYRISATTLELLEGETVLARFEAEES
jgi:uncharacterized lipoprotein YbaY/phosphoglycolate phosphatase-like HAD superfamily hydrolase